MNKNVNPDPAQPPTIKFELLQVKSMYKIPGKRFIPNQIGMDTDNNRVFGSFLDRDEFAIHWYQENIQDTKASRNYQTETTYPKFTVEYPILSYTDVKTDMRQLIVCNLADE